MSTQDDVLLAAFNEPEVEETSDTVDAEPSQDGAEVESEVTEEIVDEATDESEEPDETTEDTHLSENSRVIVENFETLTEDERDEKLAKLEGSGRKDQLEAAQAIRDIYGIEKPQPKIDEDIISKAVEAKLAALGINQESLEKAKATEASTQRASIITEWAKSNDIDPSKVGNDKEFLKRYHGEDLKDLPLAQRTKMALYETYGNGKQAIKQQKKAAASISVSVPVNGDKPITKEEDNLFILQQQASQPIYN